MRDKTRRNWRRLMFCGGCGGWKEKVREELLPPYGGNALLKGEDSVVGLNFDFAVMNLTKHSTYLIYNATLYFSSAVQKQYREKYGLDEMIPVAANDVAFSIHAVLMTLVILFQIYIYEAFMNFYRKSTEGFSIGNILLDFLGGATNYGQMAVQSIDQGSWVNFYGNLGKTLLSFVSIFFDLVFMIQHYILYRGKKPYFLPSKFDEASKEALLQPSNDSNQAPEDHLA
ncbi:hypothetical protein KSS87_021851 [Heliosperma pusillum]|nr:hypothetical protein KSS87_021851 [Heliosperma pusillum]